jgi:hypothetical protein
VYCEVLLKTIARVGLSKKLRLKTQVLYSIFDSHLLSDVINDLGHERGQSMRVK